MNRISFFIFISFVTFSLTAYADGIIEPIERVHEESARMVAPFDINADERTRTDLPGIFNDITEQSGEGEESDTIKPEGHRAFTYGYHRTLQSLTDIGDGDKNKNHIDEMLKTKQVTAFINAAQTQPAAAAGLHYGLMNSQLTLVNQQLSHSAFFEQMKQMPDGSQLIQAMYTNCIYPAIKKGSSFAKAQSECIGDDPKASTGKGREVSKPEGNKDNIASSKDIADHPKAREVELDEEDGDKILCTDLIFQQQQNNDVEDFKNDMIDWVGDEETIINAATPDNAAAGIGRVRIAPERPLSTRYLETLYFRYQRFNQLMQKACQAQYEGGGSNGQLQDLTKETEENIWAQDDLKKDIGIMSIEGFDFNPLYGEAMLKTFHKIVKGSGDKKVDCSVWNQCQQIYKIGDNGMQELDPEQAANSPIAKLCKHMWDYTEGVALGHTIEALARMRNIVLRFTSASKNTDARECGMRIIHDQIKTKSLEKIQYEIINHLIEVGNTIIMERSKESGSGAASATSIVAASNADN